MPLPENIIRPEIMETKTGVTIIEPGTPFRELLRLIKGGRNICLSGTYGFAMSFYSWLKKYHTKTYPIDNYTGWRNHRNNLHAYQSHIWISIEDHAASLKGAPNNPWLKDFYHDKKQFMITMSDYLGMNGARQWYEKGIQYPVIDFPLHPFYGVYFPSRHEHLLLFDNFLLEYAGRIKRAIDIGTGCGILSFIMLKHGAEQVYATDINPNAIFGLQLELTHPGYLSEGRLEVEQADMLGSFEPDKDDLIVFNPPWIPGQALKTLDLASYYDSAFFKVFFKQMTKKCQAGTSIVLMFSNFALLAGLISKHPIEEELQRNKKNFQLIGYHNKKVIQKSSGKKSWLQKIRQNEIVELFVIKKLR